MSPPALARWTAIGLLGLPLYGALTVLSSLDPQPDPATRYDDWARFVTTDRYVLSHVLGSALGLIAAIFGTVSLAAHLARGPAGGLALFAMVLSVLGLSLFLLVGGVSAFAVPAEGQAHLAGLQGLRDLPPSFADAVFGLTVLAVVGLGLVGNLLLGAAVWRSGMLPRWAGALWAAGHLAMYVLGLVYALASGSRSTPPTVPLGALLLVAAGLGIAAEAIRRPATAPAAPPAPPAARPEGT